jgi:hypothetical protein
VIDDYMVASLAPVIGRDGSSRSADVVEALFDSARRSNGRSNAKVTDDDGDGDGDGDNTRRTGRRRVVVRHRRAVPRGRDGPRE